MSQDLEKFQVPVAGGPGKHFLEGLPEVELEGGAGAQGFRKL